MKEKNYLATHIKEVEGKYGSFLSVKMMMKDLKEIENKDGWVSFIVTERKEPSEKGATHYAYEDTYDATQRVEKTQEETSEVEQNDLPF